MVEVAVAEDDSLQAVETDPQAIGVLDDPRRCQAGVEHQGGRLGAAPDCHQGGEAVLGDKPCGCAPVFELLRDEVSRSEARSRRVHVADQQRVEGVVHQDRDVDFVDGFEGDRVHGAAPYGMGRGP
jgi:hypothetical protein